MLRNYNHTLEYLIPQAENPDISLCYGGSKYYIKGHPVYLPIQ
jgi:hypothetical protein